MPKKPSVFVNLYNNEWNTNFPEWQDGSWSSRVRIWPTQGEEFGRDLAVPAWEARLPLLAASAEGRGKAAGGPVRLERFAAGRALATAFGPDPDGVNPGTLLRVWDQSGVSGGSTVTLPQAFVAAVAQPVNLRGEKIGPPIAIENHTFTFELHAFAPATFVVGK